MRAVEPAYAEMNDTYLQRTTIIPRPGSPEPRRSRLRQVTQGSLARHLSLPGRQRTPDCFGPSRRDFPRLTAKELRQSRKRTVGLAADWQLSCKAGIQAYRPVRNRSRRSHPQECFVFVREAVQLLAGIAFER